MVQRVERSDDALTRARGMIDKVRDEGNGTLVPFAYESLLELVATLLDKPAPIALILYCPMCAERHIDRGVFADKPHHTHSCQGCGHTWRPAVVHTVGVQFLPGFKDSP